MTPCLLQSGPLCITVSTFGWLATGLMLLVLALAAGVRALATVAYAPPSLPSTRPTDDMTIAHVMGGEREL